MSPRENPGGSSNDDSSGSGRKLTIDLVVKVWAPKLNRLTHKLFLLGSLKQMGSWNIQEAVQAFPTHDFHTWRVDVRDLPVNTSFEWTWVKAKPNRTDVKWERMVKRNRTIDCFGGVIHTIYGDGEEVFVQSATYAEVTTYRKVDQGQVLVLTGSSHTAGNWDLSKALKATECPRLSGYWKVQLAFDSSSSLEFKWAIITEASRKLHIMENESHVLHGRQTWLRVVAPWNVSRVFIEDTPICAEPLDHVTGRTDVLVNAKKTHTESIRQWLKTDGKVKSPALVSINNVPAPKTPQNAKATPRHTNEDKAREALKAFMAMSDLDSDKALLGLGAGQTSSRVPTVQTLDNVEDHVKKRSENKRMSKQEFERNPFKPVMPIKGKGQTMFARSSNQGCAGDSCTSTNPLLDANALVLEISESGKTASYAGWLPSDVEGHDKAEAGEVDQSKPAEEICGIFFEDDSGFDTVSQNSSRIDASSGTKLTNDMREFGLQISSQGEEKLKKHNKGEEFKGDFDPFRKEFAEDFDPFRNEEEFFVYNVGIQPSLQNPKESILLPTVSEDTEESPFFEEDDYLDFLSCKVSEEDRLVESFKREKKVEIEYIMPQVCTAKDYFSQSSGKKELKSNVSKPKQPDQAEKRKPGSKATDDFDYTADFDMMSRREDTPDMEEKRVIARMLEEHWGNVSDARNMKTDRERRSRHFLDKLSLSQTFANNTPRPSSVSFFNSGEEGMANLIPRTGSDNLVAPYSTTELANVVIPPCDNVNHRLVARKVEREWGMAVWK